MRRKRCSAPRAPWHNFIIFIEKPLFINFFYYIPDRFNKIVMISHIRILLIKPETVIDMVGGNLGGKGFNHIRIKIWTTDPVSIKIDKIGAYVASAGERRVA